MIFWMWHKSTSNKIKKSTSGTTSNWKASSQQKKKKEEAIDKMKKQSTEWEKIFENHTSDKGWAVV